MTTISVANSDYTVTAGQHLSFTNEAAFSLGYQNNGTLPSRAFNYGSIAVQVSGQAAIGGSNGTQFWNEAGSSFAVTGTSNVLGSTGTSYYQPSEFRNSGLFSVTATDGYATGAYVEGTQITFTNDGTFNVTGSQAVGVSMSNYAKMSNSGTIDAEGSTLALGVTLSYYMGTIDNSGTIIAHASSAANAYAIQVYSTAFQIPITNSGSIYGQIALSGAGFGSALVTNTSTGHIYGDINFSDSDGGYGTLDDNDIVHNAGTIVGNVHLGVNTDTLDGSGTILGIVTGDMGNDSLTGGAGNDVLYGDSLVQTAQDGNDTLHGGAGNDVIVGGGGNDLIDGGADTDTASYVNALSAVTVSLAVTTAQATGGAGSDTISNVENLTGSAFGDTLTGDANSNTLTGGGGDDTLIGGGGSDTAGYSGLHTDYAVVAVAGVPLSVSDTRAGTPDGADTLTGIAKLQFGDGTFVYDNAGNAAATVTDTAGTAPWSGIAMSFDAQGSLTVQTVTNDNGTHWVNSFDPANAQGWTWKVDAYDASNNLVSESGRNDDGTFWLTLNDVNNQFNWTTATIQYNANWNTVSVSGTNDDTSPTVSAASVAMALDLITWFNAPYDPNFAGPGSTALGGGSENDVLYGHAGNDTLGGGGGNDTLIGGAGDNSLTGGAGNDRFVFRAGDNGNDTITDFIASDVVELHGYGVASFTALQSLMSQSGADTIIALDTLNHITLHNVQMAQLIAGEFVLS